MKRIQILTLSTILIFATSCTLLNTPPQLTEPSELSDFRVKYLTSFDILNSTFSQSGRALMPFNLPVVDKSQARATVPTTATPIPDFNFQSLPDTGSIANYPEVGQTSTWTVEVTTVPNVYSVKVTTTFPDYDPRETQEEWYYIKDRSAANDNADFLWTYDDPVVEADGTVNSLYRLRNWLYFRDGSIQYENIVDVRSKPDISADIVDGFAAFNIEGSLDYPEVFLPVPAPSIDAPTSPEYSSVVVYTRIYGDQPAYSFWGGNRVRAIVGIRYYTEHLDPATGAATKLIGTTISFEKAVTSLYGVTGDFLDAYSSIFLPYVDANPDQSFLALSVLRQKTTFVLASYASSSDYTVDYDQSTRDTRAKTRVVNIPTQQDNYITLINDEAEAISTAYDTLWIPEASDPAILSLATAPEVNITTRTSAITTGDATPVVIVNNLLPNELDELNIFYSAIIDENPPPTTAAVSNGIVGDLTNTAVIDFDGSQGFLVTDPFKGGPAFYLEGTVQAWLYVDTQSKSSGIVHAGKLFDFSDELWSLELVGNNNTPSFLLAAQGPGAWPDSYRADLIASSERLRKNIWYHLVATWSLTGNNMSIYVNGILRGSRTFSNITDTLDFAVDPVPSIVVGSLIYEPGTELLSGYYGTDGKINGVRIENRAWTATEIKTFYDANKAKTAFW